MVGTFLFGIGLLLLGAWILLMYLWWKQSQGHEVSPAQETLYVYTQKCVRLVRRGWYRCESLLSIVGQWGNKKLARMFFSVFPDAAPAFAKRDELAGLKHGPSSFFLKSISEDKRKGKKTKITLPK